MSERPVAVVTGASMGIGEAFADALALRGHDLVLVARSREALERIAARVGPRNGIRADVLALDLEAPDAPSRVAAFARERFGHVDLLVNNAGYGAHGRYETLDLDRQRGQIRLNVEALVALTTLLLPEMLARGRGGVINVASTAGFQPVPYMAVYGATKAFVLAYSEALAAEVRARGVRVLAICPGATATRFFARAGEGAQIGRARTSADVVRTALRAYDRGDTVAVDGALNRMLAFSPRIAPRALVARIGERLMRPRGGEVSRPV